MEKYQGSPLLLGATMISLLCASGAVHALGEKACKNSVAERFTEASMAEISVSASVPKKNGEARVDWSVQSEKVSAMGTCKINKGGDVVKVKVDHHKKYQDSTDSAASDEQDGFYYDKHIGKWRDPAGEVCHTCTPENGFPDHASNQGSGQNELEKKMEKAISDSLSEEDIKALNSLK